MIGPIYALPVQPGIQEKVPWAKPIRIFQFVMKGVKNMSTGLGEIMSFNCRLMFFRLRKILVLAVFILTCQTMSNDDSPFGQAEAVAITALFGAFLIITLVDMISQCTGDPIPDTPMFLLGILGASFFIVAAIGIFLASRKDGVTAVWRFIIASIIAVTCAILFLLDVILIFLYGY